MQKYGGEKYLERVPRELLGGQTEEYVEYSRTGQVVKGMERAKAKSKYDEDRAWFILFDLQRAFFTNVPRHILVTVYPGNHTSVWGSFYAANSAQWGFACCHSTIKNSYCAGSAAIEAAAAEAQGGLGLLTSRAEEDRKSAAQLQVDAIESGKGKRKALDESDGAGRKKYIGEGDVDQRLDKDKLDEILRGKSQSFAGKPTTEEEMGTFSLYSLSSLPSLNLG